ncbi:hypothetical protein [Spirosoma aerolatum]|uniref:hypothetical protein n=1 Tax=Spirosoma aerolatum TaxID=1211326 RepID=UPI0012D2EBA8|nr:hypothetical protein [Spirosoma aerolatum]
MTWLSGTVAIAVVPGLEPDERRVCYYGLEAFTQCETGSDYTPTDLHSETPCHFTFWPGVEFISQS